jgi:uncharacterized protein (TIGR03437 family)
MQRRLTLSQRLSKKTVWRFGTVCRILRGIVLHASWIFSIPQLMAGPVPWGVHVQQTGINPSGPVLLSPNGDLFFGNSNLQLIKMDPSGQQIFSVALPGGRNASAIVWSADGNILVASTFGLAKLSAADGHTLYSKESLYLTNGLAGDSAGNAYLAGTCSGGAQCVEKLDPSGNLIYQSSIPGPLSVGYLACITADANGNAYVAGASTNSSFLAKLNTEGGIEAFVSGNPNETGVSVGLDSEGNPEVLMVSSNLIQSRVLKYDSTLSKMLFATPVPGFLPMEMQVAPNGAAVLLGGTDSVDFQQLHPTAVCSLPASPEILNPVPLFARGIMVRLNDAGNIIQSTFFSGDSGFGSGYAQPEGAEVAIEDGVSGQIELLTMAPSPEVQLGCLGNAASLLAGPLAPLEVVSIFGQSLGPVQGVSGQPGASHIYPFQLADVQVTFDGVLAPLLYVSAGQINAVTPLELEGRKTTHVCASVNGMATNCMDVPVQEATPGIFLSGGYAAALNQDGTINSQTNPAPVGSVVSIFATGLGTITPPLPDGSVIGLPLPSQSAQIAMSSLLGVNDLENAYVYGGVSVLYAGPAPYEIEGLSQINFQVPQTGATVFIAVSSAGLPGTSTATTTIGAPIWTTGQTGASCELLATCY